MNIMYRCRVTCVCCTVVILLVNLLLTGAVLGQEAGSAIKPEKPQEAILKYIFHPLAEKVGEAWALTLLIIVGGIITYIVKDAIPAGIKWFFSKIANIVGRFHGQNLGAYLKSVVDECKEVRVGYKNFDIDVARDYVSLRIQTGKSARDIELKEATEVLGQHQLLVVRGHPGAGKTTLLKFLTIKHATRQMKALHGKHLIPIFVTLKNAGDTKDLLSHIVQRFDRFFKRVEQFLLKNLESGNCIVFLDGVDEVSPEMRETVLAWIEDFAKRFGQNRIIVTLRKEGYEKVGFSARFEEAEVAGLTRSQMKNLAYSVLRANQGNLSDRELDEKCNGLMAEVTSNDRLELLAENPMLLSIIALVYDEEGSLPRKRVELYERCVRLILAVREIREARIRHRLQYSVDQKYTALRKIALEFAEDGLAQFDGEKLTQQIVQIAEDINLPTGESAAFIDELCKIGILRRVSILADTYDFVHKTFLEYFAAREIQESQQAKEPLIFEKAEDPSWREVILLYAGLLGDPKKVVSDLMKQGNIALAGECFLNTRIPIEAIRKQLMGKLLAQVSIENAEKERASHVLIEMYLPNLAAVTGQEEAQDFLEGRLNDPLERPEVKAAIYKESLRLSPEKAASFAERFDLVYIPAGRSVIGVESPQVLRESDWNPSRNIWQRFVALIKRRETISLELARREVNLPAFFIDKFPVTNEQYGQFSKRAVIRTRNIGAKPVGSTLHEKKLKNPNTGTMKNGTKLISQWSGFRGSNPVRMQNGLEKNWQQSKCGKRPHGVLMNGCILGGTKRRMRAGQISAIKSAKPRP